MQDLYMVSWLIQNTEKPSGNIKWHPGESGTYVSTLKNDDEVVEIKIYCPAFRTGARVVMEFSTEDLGRVYIEEPHMSVSFRRKFDSMEDEELADVLNRLYSFIKHQHVDRESQDLANKVERKKAIFRKILDSFWSVK
jgi:hypothetical protein